MLSGLGDALADAQLDESVGRRRRRAGRARAGVEAALCPPGRGGLAPNAEQARFRLFRAVSALLKRAAAARGALVVLDDLHAADESSLLLLHFLARELRTARVLLVCTFRDVEARLSPEVGEALGRLTREGTTLALSRLREARRRPPAELARRRPRRRRARTDLRAARRAIRSFSRRWRGCCGAKATPRSRSPRCPRACAR